MPVKGKKEKSAQKGNRENDSERRWVSALHTRHAHMQQTHSADVQAAQRSDCKEQEMERKNKKRKTQAKGSASPFSLFFSLPLHPYCSTTEPYRSAFALLAPEFVSKSTERERERGTR